jgi:hypothetical protein
MLPVVVCAGGSLNAKTVRQLLKEFETWYVITYVLGMMSLLMFLFREQPAKIAVVALTTPALLLAGFQDACAEGSRLLNSRIFFVCNNVGLMLWLALVSLKLGAYADYSLRVSTFVFMASSMFCNATTTVLLFGLKNMACSLHEPGSLVVLVSAVCNVFCDADALAVLKGAYSLIGEAFGKFARNKTVEKYLKERRKSIVELTERLVSSNIVVPAPRFLVPTEELTTGKPVLRMTPETEAVIVDESLLVEALGPTSRTCLLVEEVVMDDELGVSTARETSAVGSESGGASFEMPVTRRLRTCNTQHPILPIRPPPPFVFPCASRGLCVGSAPLIHI